MDTRIQFEETKCPKKQMADQQRKTLSHDAWLTEQISLAFDKYDSGKAVFVDNESAKSRMEAKKIK